MESNLIFKWMDSNFFTNLTKIKCFKNPKNWFYQIESSNKQLKNKIKVSFQNYEPNIGVNIILIFIYQRYVIFTFGVKTFNDEGLN
jgi:hypothetical protein